MAAQKSPLFSLHHVSPYIFKPIQQRNHIGVVFLFDKPKTISSLAGVQVKMNGRMGKGTANINMRSDMVKRGPLAFVFG